MDPRLQDYVKKLTGKEVVHLSDLTSAQRARAIAWSKTNGIQLSVDPLKPDNKSDLDVTARSNNSGPALPLGLGIDAQATHELFPEDVLDLKGSADLRVIFTDAELAYAEAKADPLLHLAGVFAAKEAYIKATGVLVDELCGISVRHQSNGAPIINDQTLISISYSGKTAYAVALCGNFGPHYFEGTTSPHSRADVSSDVSANADDVNLKRFKKTHFTTIFFIVMTILIFAVFEIA